MVKPAIIDKPILFLACFFCLLLQAQPKDVKKERESRIKAMEFPAAALELVEQLPVDDIKFYRETDGEHTSYEAKGEYQNRDISIEFSQDGKLEDIELEIRLRRLPDREEEAIKKKIDSIAERNRINKVQLQFLFDRPIPSNIIERLDALQFNNYEIIAGFKTNKDVYYLELLMDRRFHITQTRKVVRRAYDFILF